MGRIRSRSLLIRMTYDGSVILTLYLRNYHPERTRRIHEVNQAEGSSSIKGRALDSSAPLTFRVRMTKMRYFWITLWISPLSPVDSGPFPGISWGFLKDKSQPDMEKGSC
jgi:hypothetical protein